jgi:hypothetical protein
MTDAGRSAIRKFINTSHPRANSLEDLLRLLVLIDFPNRKEERQNILREARRMRLEAPMSIKNKPFQVSEAAHSYARMQGVYERARIGAEVAALAKLARALSK